MTYAQQTLNPAQTADQRRIVAALARLGWTRRRLADQLHVNMYAVWRAQNGRVRLNEVDMWNRFIASVTDGTRTEPSPTQRRALAVLDRADKARSITTLREIIAETRAILKEEM